MDKWIKALNLAAKEADWIMDNMPEISFDTVEIEGYWPSADFLITLNRDPLVVYRTYGHMVEAYVDSEVGRYCVDWDHDMFDGRDIYKACCELYHVDG